MEESASRVGKVMEERRGEGGERGKDGGEGNERWRGMEEMARKEGGEL